MNLYNIRVSLPEMSDKKKVLFHNILIWDVPVYGFTSIILHVMLHKSQQIGCSRQENVYCCLGNHYTVEYTHYHQKQIQTQ